MEIPGRSSSPIIASVSATTAPAWAMPSISASDLRMIIDGRPSSGPSSNRHLLERGLNLGEDLVRGPVRMDGHEAALGAVVLDQRLRLSMIELQARPDRLRRVVGAPFLSCPLEQALDADLVRDLEREHDRQLPADFPQHRVEGIGLRRRPRKAVQDETVGRIGLFQPLPDQLDHQVVRDELPSLEDWPDLPTER